MGICVCECVCIIYKYTYHLFYTLCPSVSLSHTHNWVDKKSVMRLLLVIAKSIAIWYGYIIALSRMIGYFWIIKLSTNKPSPPPFLRTWYRGDV